MRIAYIDAKVNNPPEDYSINPRRYGGGAVVARYCKELLNGYHDTFHIFASPDCFENLEEYDNRAVCFSIEDDKCECLRNGVPVRDIIPKASSYDLFLFHHDCMTLNMVGLKAPLVHWALMGDGRANHPSTPYSLLYLHDQRAIYGKTLYITLGKPIPKFQGIIKKDYLFQCTRHDPHTNSIEVAKFCLDHNKTGYFAGPIHKGYNLLDYIDNKYTFYLGSISEQKKLEYTREARFVPLLFQWDTPFNQTAIESLSCGTPLVVNSLGFLKQLVKDNINGIVYNGNLLDAWDRAPSINSLACWESVRLYSEVNMVASFKSALSVVLRDFKL